jgi:hypothetical protein
MTEGHHFKRDLEQDAAGHIGGLKEALAVAAPSPIPWEFAKAQYAAGRWEFVRHGLSAALVSHSMVAGSQSTSIVAMAGDLGDCATLVALIEDSAVNAGSAYVVFIGRRGWVRAFPEYEEKAVIGVKELPWQAR